MSNEKATTERLAELSLDTIKAMQERAVRAEQQLAQAQEELRLYKDAVTAHTDKLEAQLAQLQKFKDYVHKRLDDAGIEKEPNGEHSKAGCRIGDRLDIVLDRLTEMDDLLELVPKNEKLEQLLAEANRKIEELQKKFYDAIRNERP